MWLHIQIGGELEMLFKNVSPIFIVFQMSKRSFRFSVSRVEEKAEDSPKVTPVSMIIEPRGRGSPKPYWRAIRPAPVLSSEAVSLTRDD